MFNKYLVDTIQIKFTEIYDIFFSVCVCEHLYTRNRKHRLRSIHTWISNSQRSVNNDRTLNSNCIQIAHSILGDVADRDCGAGVQNDSS